MTSCIFQINPSPHFWTWTSIHGHPYLTYLPKFFLSKSKLFFQKKFGSKVPYLPTVWTYVQNFVGFFYDPHLTIQLAISQSPRISVASYFATFADISAISSQILMGKKEKNCLFKEYNLVSHLSIHQLVSHNCRDQLFCYFWLYFSHFL